MELSYLAFICTCKSFLCFITVATCRLRVSHLVGQLDRADKEQWFLLLFNALTVSRSIVRSF